MSNNAKQQRIENLTDSRDAAIAAGLPAAYVKALQDKIDELKEPDEKNVEKHLINPTFNIPVALNLTKVKITVKKDAGAFVIEVTPDASEYFKAIQDQRKIEQTLRDIIKHKFPTFAIRAKIIEP